MFQPFHTTIFSFVAIITIPFSVGVAGEQSDPAKTQAESLVIHEWGTFTELQNENGEPLPGINIDDEPVPEFVHGFGHRILSPTLCPQDFYYMKSVPYRHYQVTTRLETPVIYFYPPHNQPLPMTLDVSVGLKGGWLSEYFPNAKSVAPGLSELKILPNSYSTLNWKNLKVGTNGRYPETQDSVWLTPRATRAASVTNSHGECEKYLFYRGVGSFSGPIRVNLDREHGWLSIRRRSNQSHYPIKRAWLVQVTPQGEVAFRQLCKSNSLPAPNQKFQYRFDASEFSEKADNLKSEMHAALVENGLYADEASAMLATWNRAYFESPGLRLFYLVPRSWTDERMPLSVSHDAHIERVMIGRIELVSDRCNELIQKIKTTPVSSTKWIKTIPRSAARDKFLAGRSNFGDLGVEIPDDFKMYLDLGRFRNAMLRAEQVTRPSENLYRFMQQYRLNPPKLAQPSARQNNR